MKKILSLFIISALTILPAVLFADLPLRSEEFIYSIMAFNGRDYSATFAKQDADTIYLMADVDNFLSFRKTMTYYWPITNEWRTDPASLNISYIGILEVKQKDREISILEPTRYTYYNISGKYEYNWVVKKGDAADKIWSDFQIIVNDYYTQMTDYQNAKVIYEYMMDELATEIMNLRDEGKDITSLMEKLKSALPPVEPIFPALYNAPPEPVRESFIINLPKGKYSIRFINEDGTIMEGSECNLVLFNNRREQGIGYEIIPGDEWNRTVESTNSLSVLYTDGSTDLYLRSFYQQEYNDLFYKKMLKNDSRGNPSLMKWVRIQQVPNVKLSVEKPNSESLIVEEKPFIVEQSEGAALGYTIVPYDPKGIHDGSKPSLIALRLPREDGLKSYTVRTLDDKGNPLPGSLRQVRIISSYNSNVILIIMAILPLAVMTFASIKRKRKYFR